MPFSSTDDSDYSISNSPEPDLKTVSISLHRCYTLYLAAHMFMPFSCGTKDSDYSISDSPEPDLKTVSISLHRYYTLYLLVLSSTWPNSPVHVNLTSTHPGAEVSIETSPQT
jgi:hypothetical protein